jgi:hypothetical protein
MSDAASITIEEYDNLIGLRDVLMLDKQAQRNQVIPDEVKAELEGIDAEFADKEEKLAAKIEEAEKALKAKVVAAGATIEGKYFNFQYTKGGFTVKVEDVLRVADRWEKINPEFSAELRSVLSKKNSFASKQPKRG